MKFRNSLLYIDKFERTTKSVPIYNNKVLSVHSVRWFWAIGVFSYNFGDWTKILSKIHHGFQTLSVQSPTFLPMQLKCINLINLWKYDNF
jgi:hypothetical protein